MYVNNSNNNDNNNNNNNAILTALELNLEIRKLSKKIRKFIGNKNVKINIYRIQAYNLMCGYFCLGFIDFVLKGKSLLEFTNLFFPNEHKKSEKIIYLYYQLRLVDRHFPGSTNEKLEQI